MAASASEGTDVAELDPGLNASLETAAQAAASSWRDMGVQHDGFVDHLRRRLPEPSLPALERLHVADLYLAWACARGSEVAHRVFDEQFIVPTQRLLVPSHTLVDPDEFRQSLRSHLLVGLSGAPPRIASYSGRGRLVSWVRITGRRLLIDIMRSRGRGQVVTNASVDEGLTSDDAELRFLKASFRDEFQAAFDAAFQGLAPRQRTLLRYRYVDGLEVAQIAKLLQRHRVNVSRALTRAREDLLVHLRRALVEHHRVPSSQVESLIRMMHSQIGISLSRLLGEAEPTPREQT